MLTAGARRDWAAHLCLFSLGALALGAPASAQSPLVGTRTLDFTHTDAPPMDMPTAVTVAADGTLFVADGVNDRILEFAPDGKLRTKIRRAGAESLLRPLSVRVDAGGRLWIADTGAARILVRAADDALVQTIAAPPSSSGHPVDITDVARPLCRVSRPA